jgi:hypothetical protein
MLCDCGMNKLKNDLQEILFILQDNFTVAKSLMLRLYVQQSFKFTENSL